jgi:hypothetical protein
MKLAEPDQKSGPLVYLSIKINQNFINSKREAGHFPSK